jgi:hypothetical protein
MLQNRVDPQGNIIKTNARGAWLGNRGQLHGNGKTILRPFKHKAWIICLLQFKNRHRQIMAPGLWTELFFLDEATALAAGHRPCFECRREDSNRFKAARLKGNPENCFDKKTSENKIDEILQRERIDENGQKVTFEADADELPNGVFIAIDNHPYLLFDKQVYKWHAHGYDSPEQLPIGKVKVLTPLSIVKAIQAEYEPEVGSLKF